MITLNLLIIDDEPGLLKGVCRVLQNFEFIPNDFDKKVNFKLSQSENGIDALKKIKEQKFDIILLDYRLSDISGQIILEKLNEMKYDAHTIAVTAFASLESAVTATKNGAFDFIAKPFTPEELRNVISKAATNIVLLRKAKKLEEDKRKVRFQFLSVLSHELKAPLNAIESYLRVLDDKIAGNDITSYDQMIKRSLDRIGGMRKLIYDLLDLTRIESGQKVREIREVNLIEALNRSLETNLIKANEKEIEIKTDIPEKVLMYGEISELEIMFNNLISNSIKYNKVKGSIYITIKQSPDVIKINIKDTGIGMKPEELKRLFGEFVRFKNEKTRNIEGSGLGLSILKKLVSLYSGDIKVQSEFGSGTTFNITLQSIPPEINR